MLSAQEAFGPYIDLWVKTIGIVPSIFVFAAMFTVTMIIASPPKKSTL